MTNTSILKSISLFSGAGGMDVGVINSGFDIIYANEINKHAVETYKTNIGDHISHADIEDELEKLGQFEGIDLVFGGPPCQAFSVAGKMDLDDPRARLVHTFMDVVTLIKPKMFIMENVKALAKLTKFSDVRSQLISIAENAGYTVDLCVLNSKDFGVPQSRERMFFVGIKQASAFSLETAVERYKKEPITAGEILRSIGKQGTKKNPQTCKAVVTLASNPIMRKSPYAGMLFNGAGRPINPSGQAQTLAASMGGNKTPIIDERHVYDHKESWIENYHTHLSNGGVPFNWKDTPDFIRRLTITEAKKLHSFPDEYKFHGPTTAVYAQIGNAVPCFLIEAVCKGVLDIHLNHATNATKLV